MCYDMHFPQDLLDAIEEAFPGGSGPNFVELGRLDLAHRPPPETSGSEGSAIISPNVAYARAFGPLNCTCTRVYVRVCACTRVRACTYLCVRAGTCMCACAYVCTSSRIPDDLL
jgi:hypothetical protein